MFPSGGNDERVFFQNYGFTLVIARIHCIVVIAPENPSEWAACTKSVSNSQLDNFAEKSTKIEYFVELMRDEHTHNNQDKNSQTNSGEFQMENSVESLNETC